MALGGGLGAMARDALGQALGAGLLAILVPNLVGALALGVLVEALAAAEAPTPARVRARLLVGTGFLGSFTTYSALAVGTLLTAGDGLALAAAYAVGTVVLGLVATGAGIALGGRLGPPSGDAARSTGAGAGGTGPDGTAAP